MTRTVQLDRAAPPGSVRRWPKALVWVGAAVFTAVYGSLVVVDFRAFGSPAFDFGIFDQALWLISEGHEPFVTVRGLHLLGDHSSYILYLLGPLYWVAPHPEVLLVLSVAMLAFGAPLVYAIARRFGAGEVIASLVAVTYLLHPALAWSAWDNFHPELMVIPLVLGGFLLIRDDRDALGVALLGLALLAKEDVALLVAPLGLYLALVDKRRAVGYGVAVMSMAVFVLNFAVLLPHFSPTSDLIYTGRYDRLGDDMFGVLLGLVTKPDVVVGTMLDQRSLVYLAQLMIPIPLAIVAPRLLLLGVPTYLANILSDHSYQAEIKWHYTTYLIIVLGLAAAKGGAWWSGRRLNPVKTGFALVLVAVVSHLVVAPNPLVHADRWDRPSVADRRMAEAVETIPDGASVSASSPLVSHLSHRTTIYNFPNPFERSNYGAGVGMEMPDTGSVEWVVALTDRYDDMQPVVDRLRSDPRYEIVYDEAPVIVLRLR